MKRVFRVLAAVAIVTGSATSSDAGDLLITEFMAANDGFLADEDGDTSDWLELFHGGATALNTDGWYLTDDPTNLAKWRLPPVILSPGDYLVVFASRKHRVDPASQLHTNFRLRSGGEFFAVVEPDGTTISHQFAPQYPRQLPNVSYGLSQGSRLITLVPEGAPGRTMVPADGSLGTSWTELGFNDGSWLRGATGIGYDTGTDYGGLIGTDLEGVMLNNSATAYVRIPFTVGDAQALDYLTLYLKYDDGLVAYLNGQEVVRRNAPPTPSWDSRATDEHGQPEVGATTQDFDGSGISYVLTAHGENAPPVVRSGGPSGRYLELMPDNIGSLVNTIGFARTYGPAGLVVADFDFRMPTEAGHTGCCGERADGFGFALLDTAAYGKSGPGPAEGAVWERPMFSRVFGVGFDIFDGTGNENTVSLTWNAVEEAASLVSAFQLNNGVFNHAHIEVRTSGADSLVSVTLTPDSLGTPGAPVEVFRDVRIRGLLPLESRVAFGGRTGGAFTYLHLDNIDVVFTPGSFQIAYEELDLTDRLGLLQDGDNVLAIHGLNLTPSDPDFLLLPRLEALDVGTTQETKKLYFAEPTPGEPNQEGFDGVVDDPLFSRPGGPFAGSFSLQILSTSPGAVVRYTVDGSEPTESSPLYSGPVPVTSTATVKAKGFQPDLLPSKTVAHTYLKIHTSASTFTSDLPVMVIDTFGRGIGENSWTPVYAALMDIDPANGRSSITGLTDFSDFGAVKIRGSSSRGFPKKMYGFEVRDEIGEDKDASLLGMPRQSDWVLYAPYSDKALMRNALSYQWSNEVGRYAVRTRYIELFLNTSSGLVDSADYVGVYVLMEKIKRDDSRVDITELLPSDSSEPEISGGYILKKDRLDPGDSGFSTSSGQQLAYYEPKEVEITAAQATWIRNYLNQFEAALYGPNFDDPENGYARYIDVDSFVDHHILVETTKNIDGYRLSTFMYKDRGGKLFMGPIWDYNLSLGNANYLEGWLPNGWYYPLISNDQYPWYPRLFQDPNFVQRYVDRWTALRSGAFTTASLLATVDAHAAVLSESQARNFQRWQVLGTYVWPNWFIADTWQEELNWMKGWIGDRLLWMDSNFLAPPVFNQDGGAINPGFLLEMSTPVGTIYYTIDGSDPRLPGGAVSPTARASGTGEEITLLSEFVTPEVRAMVPSNGALGLNWTSVSFDDSSWIRGTSGLGVGYEQGTGYDAHIDLDLLGEMNGVNTTVYTRYRFTVDDPSELSSLSLHMKYDDGFVAYLNGYRVASANSPASLGWDAAATAQHDDAQAVLFQLFNLAGAEEHLRAGTNVLAVHGLNANLTSSDMLIEPQLTGSSTSRGEPIVLNDTTHVRARSNLGASWSGLKEAVFALDMDLPLRMTEIMYHPPLPSDSPYDREEFEFVELQNISGVTIKLTGVRFTDGIDFDFTYADIQTLGPGEFVLVVRNLEAFSWLYETDFMNVAGEYGDREANNWANNGEIVTLVDGRDEVIHSFAYSDTWFPSTDGVGYSLTIRDATGAPETWASSDSWQPSSVVGGTPGEEESEIPDLGGRQLPGDANQDGVVSISDAVKLLRFLFLGGPAGLPCEGESTADESNLLLLDLNGDTGVDISDVVHMLAYLFEEGPPPVLGMNCVRIVGCPNRCGF